MSTIRLIVSGTETGDVSQDWSFESDRIVAAPIDGEPDLTMTIENKNYERLMSGEVTPPVAYMQGLLKSTGDTGILIDLLESGGLTDALGVA